MSKQLPGPFHPNGEVNRAYLDKLARDSIIPLVERIWATHHNKMMMTRLVCTITALGNTAHITDFFDALALLYVLVGLDFSVSIAPAVNHPAAASYFMLACLIHAEESIDEKMR